MNITKMAMSDMRDLSLRKAERALGEARQSIEMMISCTRTGDVRTALTIANMEVMQCQLSLQRAEALRALPQLEGH
jgi:hypothetical protein